MFSEFYNILEVGKGIINASNVLKSTCKNFKHDPNDIPKLLSDSLVDSPVSFFTYTHNKPVLGDAESFRLLHYWCYWAYIPYFTPVEIQALVPLPQTLQHFNYGLNVPGQPFFFITVDPYSKSIVIAIRGSYSLSDVITDVSGYMIPFMSSDGTIMAHNGFVNGAKNVLSLLDKVLPSYLEQYPDYPIKVVGHSYGAAVTSLVCFILEMNRELDNIKSPHTVRSYQYSCPPVYNLEGTAKVCSLGNQISIILGWDVVARASLSNVQLLLCDESPTMDKYSYIPGTILWITYDEDNNAKDDVVVMSPSDPAFMGIYLNENMANDHLLSRVYAYLLSHVMDYN